MTPTKQKEFAKALPIAEMIEERIARNIYGDGVREELELIFPQIRALEEQQQAKANERAVSILKQ